MKGTGKFTSKNVVPNPELFQKWVVSAKKNHVNCQLLKFYGDPDFVEELDLHRVVIDFKKDQKIHTFEAFKKYLTNRLSSDLCVETEKRTRNQAESNLWTKLRYARITASHFYEVSACRTANGSTVEILLGGKTIKSTKFMKRGVDVEEKVFEILKKQHSKLRRPGLFLNKSYALFGASPDAINDLQVFEIKAPASNDNISKYYVKNSTILPKVKAQIHLQMLMTGLKKGTLVIADENFETNNMITTYDVQYNEKFVNELIKKCDYFYKTHIFPKLITK